MEIWKEIPRSGGKYQISNYGNVYSLINNVQLKGVNNGNGYLRVKLNERLFYIHRLVAMAFTQIELSEDEINGLIFVDGGKYLLTLSTTEGNSHLVYTANQP